jgi:hypothetical protein
MWLQLNFVDSVDTIVAARKAFSKLHHAAQVAGLKASAKLTRQLLAQLV